MKRIVISAIVCLTLSVFSPFSLSAQDVLKNCNSGTTVMGIGDIFGCTINPVGDSDLFSFSGSVGETYRLTLTDRDGSSASPCLELFDPDQDSIDTWCAQNTGESREFTLAKTGTYTVFVNEAGDNQAVTYNLALQRKFPSPPDALPLFQGVVIENETISPIADSDIFLFDGALDDVIRLTLTDRDGSSASPCLELFDPDQVSIDAWCAQNTGVSREFTLAKTGTYTVFVNEAGDNQAVTYNLALQRKFPSPPDALPLFQGVVIENETISPIADSDIFLFDGALDDVIRLTLTDRDGSSASPCLELFDPDQVSIDAWCAQNTGVSREFTLAKTGTYTVFVNEAGDNQAVTYNLALQRKFPSPPDALPLFHGVVIEDETISPIADSDIFLFGGALNDVIRLTLTDRDGSSASPCLELFDPDQVSIDAWCAQNTGVSRQFTLAKTGTYTVFVNEAGDNQAVTYNLGLVCLFGICPPPPGSVPLVYTPVTPCRIVDTRKSGGAVPADGVRSYNVRGPVVSQGGNPNGCSSPKGEPRAVHINVTSVPLGNGWITAYPYGSTAPNASLVNYRSDAQNVANSGTIKTCFNCGKDISIKSGGGTTHVIIDVLGYYYSKP